MKTLLMTLLFLTVLPKSTRAQCGLDWGKLYFKDSVGEREYNRKTKKYELYYETYHIFKPSYPASVNVHIPFKGDCKGVDFKAVKTYRMIGKREFSGHEDAHERHGLTPVGLVFEKDAFDYADVQVEIADSEVILKKVKIREAFKSLKKDQHIWKMKFEFLFKDTDGIDNKKSHTADFPLMH